MKNQIKVATDVILDHSTCDDVAMADWVRDFPRFGLMRKFCVYSVFCVCSFLWEMWEEEVCDFFLAKISSHIPWKLGWFIVFDNKKQGSLRHIHLPVCKEKTPAKSFSMQRPQGDLSKGILEVFSLGVLVFSQKKIWVAHALIDTWTHVFFGSFFWSCETNNRN